MYGFDLAYNKIPRKYSTFIILEVFFKLTYLNKVI